MQDFDDFLDLLDNDNELKEEPVGIEEFVYGKQYLGFKQISDIQKMLIEHMSQIFLPQTLEKLYGPDEARRIWGHETVNEVVAMCGKGSGKDFSSRVAFCYTVYKLHCLKDPLGYYGKAAGTYIDLLNIAVNADQARNVFFEPLKNVMKQSPWFQDVGFNAQKNEVHFYEAPIRLFSGNSEAEAWEGLDLMLVVLDEIAAFKTDGQLKGENKNRLSASAIYKMSKLSVISRFPQVGKCILLSFPRFRGDFIMTRLDESAQEEYGHDPQNYVPEKKNVHRLKAVTWEMNPTMTRELLEPEYRRNPIDAKARFECEPPEMVDAFFRDPLRVRKCFTGNWTTIDAGTRGERQRLLEIPELFPIDQWGRIKSWFKCEDDYTRYIHCDLALKRDRAALAMVHVPGTRTIEVSQGQHEKLPVVKMELLRYWEAQPGEEIDFANIREFIALLCRKFPVGLVTFDRWNSADIIQSLSRRGIRADMHSVNVNDYDNLGTCFYDGRFSGYFIELLVEEELLKLQLLPNGKVDHPTLGSKDLADALAGAAYNACTFADLDNEIEIEILGITDDWEEYELKEALFDEQTQGRIRQKVPESAFIDSFDLQVI